MQLDLIKRLNEALANPVDPTAETDLFNLHECCEILGDAPEPLRRLWGFHRTLTFELLDYNEETEKLDQAGQTTTGAIRARRSEAALRIIEVAQVMGIFGATVSRLFPERLPDFTSGKVPVLTTGFKIGLVPLSDARTQLENRMKRLLNAMCG